MLNTHSHTRLNASLPYDRFDLRVSHAGCIIRDSELPLALWGPAIVVNVRQISTPS